jgi:hypothetical protein
MERKQRIRRTGLVSCIAIAAGALVLASVDASPESRQGAATAIALVIGAYIVRQRKRWQDEA